MSGEFAQIGLTSIVIPKNCLVFLRKLILVSTILHPVAVCAFFFRRHSTFEASVSFYAYTRCEFYFTFFFWQLCSISCSIPYLWHSLGQSLRTQNQLRRPSMILCDVMDSLRFLRGPFGRLWMPLQESSQQIPNRLPQSLAEMGRFSRGPFCFVTPLFWSPQTRTSFKELVSGLGVVDSPNGDLSYCPLGALDCYSGRSGR